MLYHGGSGDWAIELQHDLLRKTIVMADVNDSGATNG
jgi:hypothetical protein